MSIYEKIKKGKTKESKKGKGVVLLKTVREGILAEKALLKKGYAVRKVAPPPEYRKGCEIAIEIDIIKKEEIVKILVEYGLENQGIVPL
jgi:hypothetical protein